MKRRELLAGAAWAAVSALWTKVPRAGAFAGTLSAAGANGAEAVGRDAFLDRICDLVIPDTDTPGARAAGVPAFIALALQHGLANATPADRTQLQARLNDAAGGDFLALDEARQGAALAQLDAATFAGPADQGEPAWRRIKALIVMGYYTSEVGASRELRYALVPGRWDPDVPVEPGDRGWSSNWVGQTF